MNLKDSQLCRIVSGTFPRRQAMGRTRGHRGKFVILAQGQRLQGNRCFPNHGQVRLAPFFIIPAETG